MASPEGVSGEPPETPLTVYYHQLLNHFGPQRWWPVRTRMEVILGAILTQNTAWRNAALALKALRKSGLLRLERLRGATQAQLETCVRQAGFYRQKAATIQAFLDWLDTRHEGSLDAALAAPPEQLRRDLLALKGFGPETADAVLLYAGHRPFFVADAYTRRMLSRHGLIPPESRYDSAQAFLHQNLPSDAQLFNEFHALLVETGKRYCKREQPRCELCPLRDYLPVQARRHNGSRAALAYGRNTA
jgi:endonuclease III related protein